MPTAYPQGVAESFAEAIGNQDANIGGDPYTFLATNLQPTDTTIPVDSTIKFHTVGVVRIQGEDIPYASKTATTFLATSRASDAKEVGAGRPVYDQSRIFSEIDSARSQLHYGAATGQYLINLLENFGLPIPGGFTDDLLRSYGKYCSHVPAGPMPIVAGALDAVLNGPMYTGVCTAPNLLDMDLPATWPAVSRRLVKILEPAAGAGIYRIRSITGQTATLEPSGGTWYDAAAVASESVAFEILPYDVWEHPLEPGKFRVDILKFNSLSAVKGSAWLNGGERQTSTTNVSVTTSYAINQVIGVYLAGDIERTGTNYFLPGGTHLGSTITLGTALPSATEDVIVDYGSINSSAQLLVGPSTDGKEYYPFYLSDPASIVDAVLDVVRAAGCFPVTAVILV
mgnify:CR=1 FL=1